MPTRMIHREILANEVGRFFCRLCAGYTDAAFASIDYVRGFCDASMHCPHAPDDAQSLFTAMLDVVKAKSFGHRTHWQNGGTQ